MKSDNREFRHDVEPHPGDEEVIDYLSGRLTDEAQENVQAHLIECDECLERFRDVRDFFESHREGDHMVTADMAREWKALWERIGREEEPPPAPVPRRGRSRLPAVSFALAAALVVALALGLWAFRQRRENQGLTRQLEVARERSAQLQVEQENLAGRLRQVEQEKLDLQERDRSAAQSQGSRRPEARKPELNVPIYDLYARDFSRRSGDQSEVNRIKAPTSGNSIVLILNGEGVAASSSYRVEILSDAGRVIWRGRGLRKGHLGNLTLTIDRALLAKGTYKLKLYGQDGQPPPPPAEYLLRIE